MVWMVGEEGEEFVSAIEGLLLGCSREERGENKQEFNLETFRTPLQCIKVQIYPTPGYTCVKIISLTPVDITSSFQVVLVDHS